ncbi:MULTISPECIES: PEP-CTERM sorting domain-containing protein [unclassified Microcoleus]|uniref:PEP-CTERM sorting domain-containing protein n=1 Tax=unclassified Microcoleus TaxID=2642155 RepID=UPI002FD03726
MKLNHSTGAIAFLLATPLVTGLTVGIAPSSAATIAGSAAEVTIDNFSHRPTETGTSTNTNTQTTAYSGFVTSETTANAVFISNCHELLAANLSKSEVAGSGSKYSSLAQSEAAVIGDFDIDAEETFSFNFQTVLHLLTSVDNRQSERATVSGNISFWLIDTIANILLDSFQLASTLDSSVGISLNLFASNNFTPTNINFGFLTQGSATSMSFDTYGVYSRTFDSATNLRLVEVKNNIAVAKSELVSEAEAVPEPTTVLGTVMFLGFIAKGRKVKNKLCEVKSKV